MTRSGVGRSLRTASRQAYAPPTNGRSPGMPGSQPAAERTTVRIDRTVLRAGLRTLVVAGFAGAAWLLSANAAQAADAPVTDRTVGLSAVDLTPAPGGDGDAPDGAPSSTLVAPLTAVVTAAHQPVPDTLTATLTGAAAPAGTVTSVVLPGAMADQANPIADPALTAGAVGKALFASGNRPDGAPAPDGGAGETQDRRDVDPHRVPAGSTVSNGAGPGHLLGSVRALITSLGGPTGRSVGSVRAAMAPSGTTMTVVTAAPVNSDRVVLSAGEWPAITAGDPSVMNLDVMNRGVTDRDGEPTAARKVARPDRPGVPGSGHGHSAARYESGTGIRAAGSSARFLAGSSAGRAGTTVTHHGTGDIPVRPLPAPSGGWAGSGTPTTGSSAPSVGGTWWAVPATVVGDRSASRRLPAKADVAVLRLDAEAPTVSPD